MKNQTLIDYEYLLSIIMIIMWYSYICSYHHAMEHDKNLNDRDTPTEPEIYFSRASLIQLIQILFVRIYAQFCARNMSRGFKVCWNFWRGSSHRLTFEIFAVKYA